MIAYFSKKAHCAKDRTKKRPHKGSKRHGNKQYPKCIKQPLGQKHFGKLSTAQANRLQNAQFPLPGQNICDKGVQQVDNAKNPYEHNENIDRNTVI